MKHKELSQNVIAIGMKPASDYILRAYMLLEKSHKLIEIWAMNKNIEKAIHVALRLGNQLNIKNTVYSRQKIWHKDQQEKDFYNVGIKIMLEKKGEPKPKMEQKVPMQQKPQAVVVKT